MARIAIGESLGLPDDETYQILVDGRVLADSRVIRSHGSDWSSDSAVFGHSDVESIRSFTIAQLFRMFDTFSISVPDTPPSVEGAWTFSSLRFSSPYGTKQKHPVIYAEINFEPEIWSQTYSILTLAYLLELEIAKSRRFRYWQAEKDAVLEGFGVEFNYPSSTPVSDVMDEILPFLLSLACDVIANLGSDDDTNDVHAVHTTFSFPEAVKAACEQYLMYFGQFLSDLGISVETELKEHASNVLFTIIPRDQGQALDAIRDALSIYLQVPSSPHSTVLESSNEIALFQLNANVHHLRAQLQLAAAVLQAKDATIGALQAELDLRKYLPKVESQSSDSESVIPGLVNVKKVDYKGFEFNLPEIFRRLKRSLD